MILHKEDIKMNIDRCFYKGTIREFINIDEDTWLNEMIQNHHRLIMLPYNYSQSIAWLYEFHILQDALRKINEDFQYYYIFFKSIK